MATAKTATARTQTHSPLAPTHPTRQTSHRTARQTACRTPRPAAHQTAKQAAKTVKTAATAAPSPDLDHAAVQARRQSAAERRADDLAAMKRLGAARQEDRAAALNWDAARRRRHAARREYRAAQREAIQQGLAIEPVDYLGEHHPRLRGWLHGVMLPLAAAATITLLCLAPADAKPACVVYMVTSLLLFGVSACLHLIPWRSRRAHQVMCDIDYSNIFLTIAGTNTPVALALPRWIRVPYLCFIWAAALVGTIAHLLWKKGPDWFFTVIYCMLGLAIGVLLPVLWSQPAGGAAVCWLIAAGGACYIAGAVCFALRKPILAPGWFEYHEVFHLGTLLGWSCHCVAVYLVVLHL